MPEPESAPPGSADVNELLRLAEPLVTKIVRQRLRGRLTELRDDVAQVVRLHLWRYALPRFDTNRGNFPAFVRTCAGQVITKELARLGREPDGAHPDIDVLAPSSGAKVEELAEQIRNDPRAYLTKTQTKVFRMMSTGADRHAIAATLGVEPDTVSQICWRMRKRLVELAA